MPIFKDQYTISILGAGYVGLSLGVLLAQDHQVKVYDIDDEKVSLINSHISPIKDAEIENFFNAVF